MWEGLERITSHASADFHPTVAADQAGNTYVAWQTERNEYYENIYYRKFSGGVWGTETRAAYQYRDSSEPSLSLSLSLIGSCVYLAYTVDYYSGPNVYMLRLDEYSNEEQNTSSGDAGVSSVLSDCAVDVALQGPIAYLADWSQGMKVIDVSDQTAPPVLGAVTMRPLIGSW